MRWKRQPSRSSCSCRSRSRSRAVGGGVVAGAVALDREHHTARAGRGAWRRSRSSSRSSRTARSSGIPARGQRVADVELERVERRASRAAAEPEVRAAATRRTARYCAQAAGRRRRFERSGSMSRRENDETRVIRRLARVIATLRRRSPPSLLSGPKRYSTRPSASLP